MTRLPLLPNSFKKPGWVLFISGVIAFITLTIIKDVPGFLNVKVISLFNSSKKLGFAGIIENNILDEIIALFILVGIYMVGLSRDKYDDLDKFMHRLQCLLWAMIVNGILQAFAFIFLYDIIFLKFMMYNLFTIPIIYVFRYHYIMSRIREPKK